jgi:hypothetical protein
LNVDPLCEQVAEVKLTHLGQFFRGSNRIGSQVYGGGFNGVAAGLGRTVSAVGLHRQRLLIMSMESRKYVTADTFPGGLQVG